MGGASYMIMMMVVAAAAAAILLAVNGKTSSSELDPEECEDVLEDIEACASFFSGSQPKPDYQFCDWFGAYPNVSADYLLDACQCLKEIGYIYHPNLNIIAQQCNFSFPFTLPPINDHNCTLLGSSH